jgi:GAF domain-containing protein
MLEKATRLCEAPFGILRTWDGERFHFGAVHGSPRFSDWVRQRGAFRPERDESLLGRIIAGERVVSFADALGDEGYRTDAGFRRMVNASGIRSALTVALHKDDALLGTITVYRQEVRPFSDKQIALLENFAAQAVIAMENARLITETREALEQQTATAEVLQVINRSPGDLAPVFDAMLGKALKLCEAVCGQLATYDGEAFEFVALKGDARWLDRRPQGRLPASRGLTWSRLVAGEPFVHILDVLDTEAYRSGHEGARDAVIAGGRTFLTVALHREQALLGALTVYRQEVRPFSDKQIALLQNFAAQAVIAMENARLITETREALEQQTATAEILQVINTSPSNLAPVFDAILKNAHSLCSISHGSLQLYDEEKFRAVAVHGFPDPLADRLRQGYSLGPNNPLWPLLEGEPFVHVLDLAEIDDPISRGAAEIGGTRTLLCVALRKDDKLLGQIAAARREVRPFSEKEISLLQNFAAQAVIAMENARLITETREALEQQTATAEVLQVINSSPGDLAPVFDAILEKAHRLCGAEFGALLTYDGEFVRLLAERNLPPAWADLVRGPWRPRHDHPVARLMRGEPLFQVDDMAELARISDDPMRMPPSSTADRS